MTSRPKAAIWSHSSSTDRAGNRTCTWPTPAARYGCRYSAICSLLPDTVPGGRSNPRRRGTHVERVGDGPDVEGRAVAVLVAQPAEVAQQLRIGSERLGQPAVGEPGRAPQGGRADPPTQIGGRGDCTGRGLSPRPDGCPRRPGQHGELVDQAGGQSGDSLVGGRAPVVECRAELVRTPRRRARHRRRR